MLPVAHKWTGLDPDAAAEAFGHVVEVTSAKIAAAAREGGEGEDGGDASSRVERWGRLHAMATESLPALVYAM